MKKGKHLDLGCGNKPRNPYGFDEIYGVDVFHHAASKADIFKTANIAVDSIPFEDNMFDSVSAFDFIEHIPRVLAHENKGTRFPFIELMNEIWRVLRHDGVFYAVTPAYPRLEAFQDPTHVNIITCDTHHYFCGDRRYAKNYGFHGKFEIIEARWTHKRLANVAAPSFPKTLKSIVRTIQGKRKTHFLWELRAVKTF